MQLIEYIKRLNTKILFKYLLDGEEKVHFSESLYQKLFDQVQSDSFIEEQFESLEDDDLSLLLLIFLSGSKGVRFDESAQKSRLLRTFFVYEVIREEETFLCGFEEFDGTLSKRIRDLFPPKDEGVLINAPFVTAYKTDLALLFGLLIRDGAVLKQTGLFTKQFFDSYLAITHLGQMVTKLSVSDKEKEYLGGLFLTLLEEAGYIKKSRSTIQVLREIDQNLTSILDSLKAELLKTLARNGVRLPLMFALMQDGGCYLDKSFLTPDLKCSLYLLTWLGEIALRISDGKLTLVHSDIPRLPTHYPSGHMMPDFTVMIPREIEPHSLFEFLKIGTISSLDMIYHGTICRETIVNSVAGSLKEDSIREIITRWNGAPNLFSSVHEWIHGFNKLFIDGSYLAVKQSDADTLTALPEVAPLVSEVEGYRFFRIKSGKESLLRSMLESKSFDTRFPDMDETSHLFEPDDEFISASDEEDINFSPELESASTPKSQGGIYSSQLKSLSAGDMGKLVKYATLMDYKLTINYRDEFGDVHNHLITPINLAGGKESFIEATDTSGTVRKYLLDRIEQIGVMSDDC